MGISTLQAIDCFASDDLIGIGMEADAVRRALHADGVVSYAVHRDVRFDREIEHVQDDVRNAVDDGVTSISLVGGVSGPDGLSNLLGAVAGVRERFPALAIDALSAGDILLVEAQAQLPADDIVRMLRAAGLDAISGDIAGIAFERWLEVHRIAHGNGLRSVARMIFGNGEPAEQRVAQLFAIRALQEETSGFTAFSPVAFRPTSGSEFEEPTAVEYLRTLAIARMVLDNFDNVESSCVAQGLKVMQMALRFGANDSGSIALHAGSFTEEDLRRVIRDAGFIPVERDSVYRTMFLNN